MINPDKLSGRLGNKMFQLAYLFSQEKKGLIKDIYVQDPALFEDVIPYLKAQYGVGVVPNEYVAIHVRRGDYVNNSYYTDLSKTDYYERAMKEFPDARFKVFSDDIISMETVPIFKDCEFSYGNELEDFNFMAGAKGIIMANSSFSWWAAFLNKGKVIAPLKWYSDGNQERTKLMPEWKRI